LYKQKGWRPFGFQPFAGRPEGLHYF